MTGICPRCGARVRLLGGCVVVHYLGTGERCRGGGAEAVQEGREYD